MTADAGAVGGLWRFPVKSMGGEALDAAELTPGGLLGDRAFAILDVETGRLVSASSRHFPDLIACRAAFVEVPRSGHPLPAAHITLPDGHVVTSDSPDGDRALSAFFGREVRLARVASGESASHGGTSVEPKADSAFFAEAGIPPPDSVAGFFDLFPVSVITTSTLARLAELAPGSRFDARRFRMNVIVDTAEAGFLENDWIGRELALGDTARIQVALPDPRCVMTTLAQEDLPRDPEVLRSLVRHNRLEVGAAGSYPCAGVYAVIAHPGALRTGDRVSLGPAAVRTSGHGERSRAE